MNGTTRVLAAGGLAPECIARLVDDGLQVDERPEMGRGGAGGRASTATSP